MKTKQDLETLAGDFPSREELSKRPPDFALRISLDAIKEKEEDVRAWAALRTPTDLDVEVADASAQTLRAMPFGVKDVIDLEGLPTQCGAAGDVKPTAPYDAACVDQLRAAGGIPIGKTVTAEYAFRQPGPTRNPWNLDHTPGGSSSGSAAAVAAGMVPLALSTQTGGSIIRPASYCGTVGFKPSFGLVSRAGLKLTSESLDTIGWHASSVEYARAAAQVLLPQESNPTGIVLSKLKVAITLRGAQQQPDREASASVQGLRQMLERAGAQCQDVSLDEELDLLAQAHAAIMRYEFARNLAPVVRHDRHVLSPSLLNNVTEGFAVPDSLYLEMRAAQRELRSAWHRLTDGADLILTPSASGTAPQGHAHTGTPAFNKMWTVLGWPCLHLPVSLSSGGLPIGVQLIADWHDDFRLLEAAAAIESKLKP
jgi:Asp-tRNA(Asn)/Glu-tRNA(Gln) amidotransferase A subunit family amidase